MKVHVLGAGCLAETTRFCASKFHDVTKDTAEVLWCCIDTPIHDGKGDAGYVRYVLGDAIEIYEPSVVLISSQVPVGFCKHMERLYPDVTFAVSPENIRVASAVEDFMSQTRIVVGARKHIPELWELLSPFCPTLEWMSPESAEMVKHALNVYLAMCIRFGNEIGAICDEVGADCEHVVKALRAEPRVSPKAPILPGDPPSKHLLRDVHTLSRYSDLFAALQ